jgi:hypothetical protein
MESNKLEGYSEPKMAIGVINNDLAFNITFTQDMLTPTTINQTMYEDVLEVNIISNNEAVTI